MISIRNGPESGLGYESRRSRCQSRNGKWLRSAGPRWDEALRSELLPGPPRPAGLSLLRSVGGTFRSTPTSTIITLNPFSQLSVRPQLADSSGTSPVDLTFALSNLSLMLTGLFFTYSTRIQIIFYGAENSHRANSYSKRKNGIDKKIRVGQESILAKFRTTHTWRRRSNQLSNQIAQTLTSYTSDLCFRYRTKHTVL